MNLRIRILITAVCLLMTAGSCLYWNPFTPEDPSGDSGLEAVGDYPSNLDTTPAGSVPADSNIRINFPSGRAVTGEELVLSGTSGGTITWLMVSGEVDTPPPGALWQTGASPVTLPLTGTGTRTLFAGYSETPPLFRQVVSVTPVYPDWEINSCNTGNSHIKFWANGVSNRVATDATAYTDTAETLGPAGSNPTAVTALGNGGSITLTFPALITNGPGPDFAVFENGLLYGDGSVFSELSFVEVSSDGINFARFPAASLPGPAVGPYEVLEQGSFYGYAGGAPAGYGTLFDLNEILNTAQSLDGLINPSAISHVRIVDADAGSGSVDSFSRPVRDPLNTWGSSGFDLDGVGVINGGTP